MSIQRERKCSSLRKRERVRVNIDSECVCVCDQIFLSVYYGSVIMSYTVTDINE